MTSEIKIGDIIRCINVDGFIDAPGVGHLNQVTNINNHHSWPIDAIDLDDDNLPVAYSYSEVELVNE